MRGRALIWPTVTLILRLNQTCPKLKASVILLPKAIRGNGL